MIKNFYHHDERKRAADDIIKADGTSSFQDIIQNAHLNGCKNIPLAEWKNELTSEPTSKVLSPHEIELPLTISSEFARFLVSEIKCFTKVRRGRSA